MTDLAREVARELAAQARQEGTDWSSRDVERVTAALERERAARDRMEAALRAGLPRLKVERFDRDSVLFSMSRDEWAQWNAALTPSEAPEGLS